jgi:hypothetical protein
MLREQLIVQPDTGAPPWCEWLCYSMVWSSASGHGVEMDSVSLHLLKASYWKKHLQLNSSFSKPSGFHPLSSGGRWRRSRVQGTLWLSAMGATSTSHHGHSVSSGLWVLGEQLVLLFCYLNDSGTQPFQGHMEKTNPEHAHYLQHRI